MLNEKGQGFSVFRLLISAIMGLMILMIVLGVANYFEQIRLSLGYNEIVKAFGNSANKPDGTVIKVDGAELPAGVQISSRSLSEGTSVKADCIKITGSGNEYISIESDTLAVIKHNATITVYIRCETNMIVGCEIYCTVSLNKKM